MQPTKAAVSMRVKEGGRGIEVRLVQPEKAQLSMRVKEAGREIEERLVQFEKVSLPIVRMPFGMLILEAF